MTGLKKFSRSSATVQFSHVPIASLINEAVSLIEYKAKLFNVAIAVECDTNENIYCNNLEIEQVLVNLAGNAIDAIKNLEHCWVKVSAAVDETHVIVQVTDSGPGIPGHIKEKNYEPFYTTKPVGEGTGLGLSISKGILDEHHASITILENVPHTCFEIKFQKVIASQEPNRV